MNRVQDHLAGPMTRGQALKLKKLSREAYQPRQFEPDLKQAEALRRIEALENEITLADDSKAPLLRPLLRPLLNSCSGLARTVLVPR